MDDKVRVNVYINEELRKKAVEMARKMGLNFSAFVSLALYEFLKDSACQKSCSETE